MNKLMLLLGVAAVALGALADTKTLTWNGASGASWDDANWLDGETSSEWVDGANAVFTSAATVSIPESVTVSNLTTSGTLSIGGTIPAETYSEYLSTDSVLVFPGLTLAKIVAIDGTMNGAAFNNGKSPRETRAYRYSYNGTTGTAQFQCAYSTYLRFVVVEFTEGDGGVYAKVTRVGYIDNYSTAGVSLGDDVMAVSHNSGKTSNINVYNLRVFSTDLRLRIVGEANFGDGLSASNVVVEVTAPLSQTWDKSLTFDRASLFVTGESSATVEKTFGITDPDVSGVDSAWLNGTQTLPNMALSRTEPVRITMRGKNITTDQTATPYHVRFNGETMTCQFQVFHSSSIKCVLVEFKQTGADVTARAVQSYLLAKDTKAVTAADLDWDFESGSVPDGKKITKYAIDRYAVKSLVMRTVDAPSLTLGADNTIPDMVVDNAQVVYGAAKARPKNVVARNGASVICADGTTNSGDGYVARFKSGSTMLASVQNKTEARAVYEFDASTNYIGAWNYINELTLKNGSSVTGGGNMRCGYYNASPTSTYASVGISASSIEATINLMRHNYTGNQTNTLVFATETDLTISGTIKDHNTASYRGACIVKRGAATLTLSGANTFAGRLTVEEGTLALGGDDALPASAPLTLAGGTVTCGATVNATGALTLSGDTTINLGDGALSFADSSGETWAPDATLNIIGSDEGLPVRSVRFGTSGAGLSAFQTRRIRYNGNKVSLTDEGYLGGPKGLIISIH